MISPVEKFLMGFFAPIKGIILVFSSPKKFILSIIPFLMGLLFIAGGFYWAYYYLGFWVTDIIKQYDVLSGFLFTAASGLALIFSWIAVVTLFFLGAYALASIIGGPFYSMLAEEIFRTESDIELKGGTIRLILTMLMLSLLKLSIFAMVGFICFILSFIPIVNFFSTYIVFLVIAFDCTDYAFEIGYMSLRQRFSFFFRHLWEYTGLAGAVMATTLIPGSFFIMLPAFICGATKLYIDLQEDI